MSNDALLATNILPELDGVGNGEERCKVCSTIPLKLVNKDPWVRRSDSGVPL